MSSAEFNEYLQQRSKRKSKANYAQEVTEEHQAQLHFLSAATDWGVAYNGGRRGARFTPELLINQYKSLSNPPLQYFLYTSCCPSAIAGWPENFTHEQETEINNITQSLTSLPSIHIGGGHDHIYPFLMALKQKYPQKSMQVINIDAHLDTRTDPLPHSGTPFRQFLRHYPTSKLIQLGIDSSVNPPDHLRDLPKFDILYRHQLASNIKDFKQQLDQHFSSSYDITVISLDCDALDAMITPAVSAPSYHGIPRWQVEMIFDWVKENTKHHYLGIYEFNPLYDSVSGEGARIITSLITHYLNSKNKN